MYLPQMEIRSSQQVVTSLFRGINRKKRVEDGEFAEYYNLSTREYPMLCPRKPRGLVQTLKKPGGLLAKDKLCWVDGRKIYYNGTEVPGIILSEGEKRLVSMGAYVLIWPDKIYFNTADLSDQGAMEASITNNTKIKYTICRQDGSDYENVTESATAPADPENGDYWLDKGSEPHRLKSWSESAGQWQTIQTVYVRIAHSALTNQFAAGDTVEISGATIDYGGDDTVKPQLEALNGSQFVYSAGPGWITVIGLLDHAAEQIGRVTIKRGVPDLDFVLESENRLWGCHYGTGADGKITNEIYASRLGDFRNWKSYQGISTDSYTVSCGTDGPWTGAIAYNGSPLFFKANCVHRVYGSTPSNYQVITTQLRGVQPGSDRSLCIADGMLFYLSDSGVEMYDGSLPNGISEKLGDVKLSAGIAGSMGDKYYLSVLQDGVRHLYIYDIRLDLWTEENGSITAFAPYNGDLYMLDGKGIWTEHGTAGTAEGTISWHATTGLMGWQYTSQKYVTRYSMRMQIPQGAMVKSYLEYDSSGEWQEKLRLANDAGATRTVQMPVYPKRCDHLRMKIEGTGDVKIYSIARQLHGGGHGVRRQKETFVPRMGK